MNDYLSESDIKGSAQSKVADGRIVDHTNIILRKIQIGDKELNNIEAIVISGQDAPLLLGQSALKRLGKYTVSGNKLIFGNSNATDNPHIGLTDEEIDRLINEAKSAYSKDAFHVAAEKYKILYDNDNLTANGILFYANCLRRIGKFDYALELLLSIQSEIESQSSGKDWLYDQIATCYDRLSMYDEELLYLEKLKMEEYNYAISLQMGEQYALKSNHYTVVGISNAYYQKGDLHKALFTLHDYIDDLLYAYGLRATDCWNTKANVDSIKEIYEIIGDLYWNLGITYGTNKYYDDAEKYTIISAAWGNKNAIEWCKKYDLNYLTRPTKYSY